MRRYQGTVYDSNRWDGFQLRPGDIIIASSPKCGTTWTQMICALLILQEPELPLPLDRLSPWIDMETRARTEVFADLQAQTHRRFIKTHTPLDGLPHDPRVTYICVGRDPRDVALSIDRHIDNMNIGAWLKAREHAAAIDGVELGPLRVQTPRPDGERDRFWQWVDDETPSTQIGSSLRRTMEHLQTFRDAPNELDVVSLHYDDLKADLKGQMRQLAVRLGIHVDEHLWPRLVQAATFGAMRRRADTIVPGGGPEHWIDPAAFFSRGTSGQWCNLLDDSDLARYAARVRALAAADLVDWVHSTPIDISGPIGDTSSIYGAHDPQDRP
ncbi:sulfotransferase domain-containing protein [Geodermatophilus africanus]|uniref:sulfotransferase domain-containing protein n=1 Tax=Geodermatophilus africanus TaxID=1137993 RepID=UPI001B8ABD83|nr:sulfotransferase domain-containing protein [Geodermatophilus africanus]